MSEDTKYHSKSKTAIAAVLIIIGLVAASIVAVIVFAPKQSTENTVETKAPNTTSTDAQTSSESAKITFTNDGISPSTLIVKKGIKLTVENKSLNELEFSSDDHPSHTDDPELNMSVLQPGESASFTPLTVGTHGFHDHIDDSKVGKIIVIE